MKKPFIIFPFLSVATIAPIVAIVSCGATNEYISMKALATEKFNGFEISTYELPNQYSYDSSKQDGSVLGPEKTLEIYVSISDITLNFEDVAKQTYKYFQKHSQDLFDKQNTKFAIQVGTAETNNAWINMYNHWKKEWVDKDYMKNNPEIVTKAISNLDTETTLSRANGGAELINNTMVEHDYIDIFDRIANKKTPTSKVLDFSNWK